MPQKKTPVKKATTKSNTKPKRKRQSKESYSASKRVGWLVLKVMAAGIILFALFFTAVYLGFLGVVPTAAQLQNIKNPQASEVYSEEGKLLGRYYTENRSNVTFDEISPNIIQALIATEDARFYEHRGIDEIALFRVFIKTLMLQEKSAGGGSTISQQIAKNLFPRNNLWVFSMPVNKLREAIIAYRLERIYTKDEILTLYLNTVPFGENIFGIEVAAERFFSKKPKNLTVDEAAVLVGMLKANNAYNPRVHPERSTERRNVVIGQMVKNDFLTEEEGRIFREKPLKLRYRRISYNEGPAPYFLEMLRPELIAWCKNNLNEKGEPYNLYTDGLRIETTVNYDYQYFAQQSVVEYMNNLQGVFDNHWKNTDPWAKDPAILQRAIRQTERYKHMRASGKSEDEIKEAFDKKIETTLFTWEGDKHLQLSPLDSLKHYLKMLNAGFIAINPANGQVKAWVGGIDYRYFKYDHVTAARQVGSSFKPFVYLAALEQGLSPYSYYANERKIYEDYQDWSPRNSHEDYEGYYSMREALARSINTVAVDVLMQTGIDKVIETSHELGISRELPRFPSLALGVASISLKEMVSAYGTVLNEGIYYPPNYLVSIKDKQGKVLAGFEPPLPRYTALNEENCRILVHMMQSVIDGGTGSAIRSVYRVPGEFAGKTGTTQDHADGWFIGMNPRLVTGCWVGAADPGIHFRTITYGQGAYMALPIVGKFYSKMYSDQRYRNQQFASFRQPAPEILAALDIPGYRDEPEKEDIGKLIEQIFARGKNRPETQPGSREPETKKIWETFKDIFKKKK
ncbi:penicillin-binding protein 1A [Gaoshiqia sp. Z1-71]|uniref:penicillin-binding protein 1A n=1 Tax=Gaoshiqia hydrogeniformans TaxID=3290090 RepID=UPI003BF8B3F6